MYEETETMKISVLLFLATLVATSHATCLPNPIRLLGDIPFEDCIPNPVHVLRPQSGSGDLFLPQINCLSWRLAVETNNLRNWATVPKNCIDYVGNYTQGKKKQYPKDCNVVADIAIKYAESVKPIGDGKDIWVFDLGDTALSSVPYYARSDVAFGGIPFNSTKFNEWLAEGVSPAVPEVLRLYNKLYELGFKVVFLSGTSERLREVRVSNLISVGYTTWEKLILKGDADRGERTSVFKSKKRTELVQEGYRIIGNVGDQWSDLTGMNAGYRTFKVPNPMYYVG